MTVEKRMATDRRNTYLWFRLAVDDVVVFLTREILQLQCAETHRTPSNLPIKDDFLEKLMGRWTQTTLFQ
jgi:hypothetical protein